MAENLKKKIDEARRIVEKLDLDEPYKSEAFGAILTWSLVGEKVEEELKEKPKRVEIGLEKGVEKLAKDAGVTRGQLNQIFDLGKDDLTISVEAGGESDKEKQLRATLVILTGFSYCYRKEEIHSIDLKKKLKILGIPIANLARNLAEYPRFVLSIGKPKSPKFRYKITVPGKREGLRIIRELAGGSKVKATQEIESA